MQHDLFANPNRRERRGFPFIVGLQPNVVEVQYRIVAPLAAVPGRSLTTRLVPIVQHNGQNYAVLFNLITHLSGRLLRQRVGSIAHYRDDLTRALDWLFFGI
jgi:toxin CcdB